MTFRAEDFRLRPGRRVRLDERPTRLRGTFRSKGEYRKRLGAYGRRLRRAVEVLRASKRHAVLLVLQGADAAGKDGSIERALRGVSPLACRVHSFGPPTESERSHDFLWRCIRRLPARGELAVFNRSYYEEVLVPRVHPKLLEPQGFPAKAAGSAGFWKRRFRSIADFERHLRANGTRVIKVYFHLSADEQRRRFIARIDRPDKNWKFDDADLKERAHWREYRRAYERCLTATGTRRAPWHLVPADDKRVARVALAAILTEAVEGLPMRYPKAGKDRRRELKAIRKSLAQSDPAR